MSKRRMTRYTFLFLTLAGWLFFTPQQAISAQPGIELFNQGSGVCSWTGSGGTYLEHWVKVIDYDGVAGNGTSHTVTVTYPDGVTEKTLQFDSTIDATSAYYWWWDDDISQPIDVPQYSGNYVYRVEDSTLAWSEATDGLIVNPVAPLDETGFSPAFNPPQSITAFFDNVYVNGALYDDFNSGFDDAKWNWQPPELSYVGGEARFEYLDSLGRAPANIVFNNSEGINTIKATVRVTDTDAQTRATIGGTFYNDGQGDALTLVGIAGNQAIYSCTSNWWEGSHRILSYIVPQVSLGPVTTGNRYDISIDWNGTTFTFAVTGLNDSIQYSATYSPSGSIFPPNDKSKLVRVDAWNLLETTTPTFDWNEVPGATHYRVRIYGLNDSTIYNTYPSSPPYELPPGILKPNGIYKYRIYAFKHHQWFDWDNSTSSDRNKTWFISGPDEAQKPYVEFHQNGVYTWNDPFFGPHTDFYLKVHDAQGIPGNISSVKALFPDNTTEIDLYLDYNESSTRGLYRAIYFGVIQSGEYKITVIDKDGNSATRTEILAPDPIGYPAEDSLAPAHNVVAGSTGVNFDWDDVDGAAFYQVDLYDKDGNKLFDAKTTESRYVLPPGILKEESQYRYRIKTQREFYEDNMDNGSAVPSSSWMANNFFTTHAAGSNNPSLSLESYGVLVFHAPHPGDGTSVYELDLTALVSDNDGVPENIKRVEVTFPDTVTTRILRYGDDPAWESNYHHIEYYSDPSDIQSGTYTFRVVDFEDNEATITDILPDVAAHVIPWAVNTTPADGTLVSNAYPTITWDPVFGATTYTVRIMSACAHPTIHWSGQLTQTQYTVPKGILQPDTTYGYRIYAFHESGGNVDFVSCNRYWHELNSRFTTPVNSDADGLPDELELSGCTDPYDADTDDDGILDGVEDANQNGIVDPGETDPCNADTDGDGIQDGTELGYTLDDIGPDTNLAFFIPDADPITSTDPLNDDTDDDGIKDGEEDQNFNGAVDEDESDPSIFSPRRGLPFLQLLLED